MGHRGQRWELADLQARTAAGPAAPAPLEGNQVWEEHAGAGVVSCMYMGMYVCVFIYIQILIRAYMHVYMHV